MASPPADLLTHLLNCRDEAGRPIDDRLIRDQVVTTIFGGYEATATALHWMWLLLDKHPYADAMIADIENFKKLTGIEVTYDVFPEDVYFDKVTAALSSCNSGLYSTGRMLRSYGHANSRGCCSHWMNDTG